MALLRSLNNTKLKCVENDGACALQEGFGCGIQGRGPAHKQEWQADMQVPQVAWRLPARLPHVDGCAGPGAALGCRDADCVGVLVLWWMARVGQYTTRKADLVAWAPSIWAESSGQ